MKKPHSRALTKALSWRNAVNQAIKELPEEEVRTYINAYDSKPSTMEALVEKLLSGKEAFKGVDPIDSFCGLWDAKI